MSERVFNIHDVFLILTVAECLLLALFQQVTPNTRRLDRALVAGFLVSLALSTLCVLLFWNTALHISDTFDKYVLPYVLVGSLLCRGPFLYLYVKQITKPDIPLKPIHLVCFLPVLFSFIYIYAFSFDSSQLRSQGSSILLTSAATLLWDSIKLVSISFALTALILVKRHENKLKQEYADFSRHETHWLYILTAGFFLSWIWGFIVHLIGKYADISASNIDTLGILANYITFILINVLFVYSLVYAQNRLKVTIEDEDEKSKDEALDDDELRKLKTIMEEDRIYLRPNINIEAFAEHAELPVKTVSTIINTHFGTNFFEFVNSYRVEMAKSLLADPEHAKTPVMEIMSKSGFNSKSAFHRFFKRFADMSPSEYRKKAQQEKQG